MTSKAQIRVSFQLGDDQHIVIRLSGRSNPIVAKALGIDRSPAGEIQREFLDRTIHSPSDHYDGGWIMWGAVSTIIERNFS